MRQPGNKEGSEYGWGRVGRAGAGKLANTTTINKKKKVRYKNGEPGESHTKNEKPALNHFNQNRGFNKGKET